MIASAWARLSFITVIDPFSFFHQILRSFVAILIFSSQGSESASKYIKMLSFSGLGSITLNRYNYVCVGFGLRSSRFLSLVGQTEEAWLKKKKRKMPFRLSSSPPLGLTAA